jgi:Predicted hydrolase (metallo-beta-lactamase superfamily)
MSKPAEKHNQFLSVILYSVIIIAISIIVSCALNGGTTSENSVAVSALAQKSGFQGKTIAVHFLDVGQGDCALIQTDNGKFLLIDTGTVESGEKVSDYLKQNKVKEIEYAVFTHPHDDHIGGAEKILKTFDVKHVLMPETVQTTTSFSELLKTLQLQKQEKKLQIISPKVGDRYSVGGTSFQVLSPLDAEAEDANNSSLVLKFVYKDVSFLFTGDAENKAEKEMLSRNADLDSDVLKAGHHGSDTSSTADFIKAVSPDAAVISCGKGNSYGHPSPSILDRFHENEIQILRTDLDGDIVFVSDGETYKIYKTK